MKPRIINLEDKVVLHLEDRILTLSKKFFNSKHFCNPPDFDLPREQIKKIEEVKEKLSEEKKRSVDMSLYIMSCKPHMQRKL